VYCIEVDSEDHLFELTEGDLITHNCRLRLDFTELKNRGGGLFGANSMTGSIGVATLNLPDAAIEANGDKDKLFEILTRRMDIAAQFLDDRRTFIESSIEKGLYPFSRRWLQGIKDKTANDPDIKRPGYYAAYFSTIGIIGGHEMCLNFLGKGIETEEGAKLALEVQEFIKSRLDHYREKYHTPFNLEATPAEGVCYRLAKCLKTKFPTAKMVEELREHDEPYLTNSTALPVGFTNDLYTAITHQSKLQVMYTGGTVFHIFLGEAISNPEAVKEVVRMVCTTTPIPYITLSPEYSICRSHGYLAGEQPECPTCHSDTEVYARVVGFYTPMNRWNKGKRTEGTHRKSFDGIVDVLKIE
jgi:ribonucleoside-triphosphate reductase